MIKKRELSLIIGLIVLVLCMGNVLAVSSVNLKITGVIGDYSSRVILRTDSNAGTGFDPYDMPVKNAPSDYSNFYSSITSASLAIDSWDDESREVDLVYQPPTGQSGNVVFSWNQVTGTNYQASFSITGSVTDLDMSSTSSYTYSAPDDSTIYITVNVEDYPSSQSSSDSGGSSGGGGITTSLPSEDIEILTDELNVYMAIDVNKPIIVRVNNLLDANKKIKVSSSGFSLTGDTEFDLKPGMNDIQLKLDAVEETGIYTGKLNIDGHIILVSLNVQSKELLFDVSIVVGDSSKKITGNTLDSQITLIPMSEDPRVDVTLNYIIKDFEGRTWLTESETILVEGQTTFKKSFSNLELPPGKYTLGLELIYPNGVAVSSSNFEVEGNQLGAFNLGSYKLIIAILFVGITILILLILMVLRKPRRRKR